MLQREDGGGRRGQLRRPQHRIGVEGVRTVPAEQQVKWPSAARGGGWRPPAVGKCAGVGSGKRRVASPYLAGARAA